MICETGALVARRCARSSYCSLAMRRGIEPIVTGKVMRENGKDILEVTVRSPSLSSLIDSHRRASPGRVLEFFTNSSI
jgi:hypothetical protein